jgi:hypothetical protein
MDWKTSRTLIQDFNSNLISLSFFTNDVLSRDLQVIKVQCARRTGTDTKFLLLLSNLDAHVLGG